MSIEKTVSPNLWNVVVDTVVVVVAGADVVLRD